METGVDKGVGRVRTVSRDTVRRIVRELGFDPRTAFHIEISPDEILCRMYELDEQGRKKLYPGTDILMQTIEGVRITD